MSGYITDIAMIPPLPSVIIGDKYGGRGSPSLKPHDDFTKAIRTPFIINKKELISPKLIIKSTHVSQKTNFTITSRRKLHSTLS